MPTRAHRNEGAGRVGDMSDKFTFGGICLIEPLEPVHNDLLEALITGPLNPFSRDAREKLTVCVDEYGHVKHLYCSSVWNLAVKGVAQGADPFRVCCTIRQVANARSDCNTMSLSYLINGILQDEGINIDAGSSRDKERKINPIVTQKVLDALAEEGILPRDAGLAVTDLVESGELSSSTFKEGGVLFFYGDDRRHVVNRILNRVSRMHEGFQGRHDTIPQDDPQPPCEPDCAFCNSNPNS